MQIQKDSGIFITLEGIDGSGKSSLAAWLVQELPKYGYTIFATKEPGGTSLGSCLRSLVMHSEYTIAPETEFLLFAADRAQHYQEVIKPALEQHALVICDRSADSSLAYQGFGRGLDKNIIQCVNNWALDYRRPDITLYIKVDYALACERIAKRNETLTVFEKERSDFFERVIAGFETIFHNRSHVILLDGTQQFEQVRIKALEAVLHRISELGI